ncbi:hypothetical protein DL96DRAFT_366134 [Flagelloscypha sp. PMI_526]|nr:hypothetical protein DL96DRAFT_366134 [Flagelloscypha sp. PMI_526]
MSADPQPHPSRSGKRCTHSKKGCLACRIRRVKCDEVRPICTACSRRRETCLWNDNQSALHILPRMARAALNPSKNRYLSLPPLSEMRPQELELLHTWTTITMFTFVPTLPAVRYAFQVSLPQFAFQNTSFLHALFAVTSLHMHYLLPSSNYLPRAKMYCERAVFGLFQSASTTTVPPDILVMAEILLATFWLAFPAWETKHNAMLPDVFNWFPAAGVIMRRATFYRQSTNLPRFLPTVVTAIERSPFPTPFAEIFTEMCHPEMCPFDTEELKDKQTLAVYETGFYALTHCTWGAFMIPELSTLAVSGFLWALPDDFFKLFLEKRPRALILVAHYCAILGQFDGVWWYSWERFRHDLQQILSLIHEKWLPWMEYPLNVLAMKEEDLGDASML